MIRLDSKNVLVTAAAMLLAAMSAAGSIVTEIEADGSAVNNNVATAQTLVISAFTLPAPASVFNPPGYATATVQGSGGFFGYGGRVLLDMDNPVPSFDPLIALFDSNGTLLAYSDDSMLDSGSVNPIDSFIGSYLLPAAGYYFVAISESPNFPTVALTGTETPLTRPDRIAGGFAVSGVSAGVSTFDFNGVQPGGADYTLHISAQSPVPEPGSLALAGGALIVVGCLKRRLHR
jgi:hypothetical protein